MELLLTRLGVVLVALSLLPWLVVLGAPIALGASARAAAWSGGAAIIAEVLFWIGVALLGKPVWSAVKEQGWRKVPSALWQRFLGREVESSARTSSSSQ
jgi:hypothetical protein